jgi:hypothetical protein
MSLVTVLRSPDIADERGSEVSTDFAEFADFADEEGSG